MNPVTITPQMLERLVVLFDWAINDLTVARGEWDPEEWEKLGESLVLLDDLRVLFGIEQP